MSEDNNPLPKELILETYRDIAQPAAREIGSALGRTVRVLLSPGRAALWSAEQVEDYLVRYVTDRLADSDPQSLKPVPGHLLGPVIYGTASCGADELRQMYAELLATSMKTEEVHPAFGSIIRELSPDEARILALLKVRHRIVTIELRPAARGGVNRDVVAFWTLITHAIQLDSPGQIRSYLDNLVRLGLLERIRDSDMSYDFEREFDPDEIAATAIVAGGSDIVTRMTSYYDKDGNKQEGMFDFVAYPLTVFGESFVGSCVAVSDAAGSGRVEHYIALHRRPRPQVQ